MTHSLGLLGLVVSLVLLSSVKAAKHKFKANEKIILWANKGKRWMDCQQTLVVMTV